MAQNGYLEMRTTASSASSTVARIQELVEEGQAQARVVAQNAATVVGRNTMIGGDTGAFYLLFFITHC